MSQVERPIDLLRSRVKHLDESEIAFTDGDQHLRQFIRVMSRYVNGSMGPPAWAVIQPTEADDLTRSSWRLSEISIQDRNISDGPLLRREQHWVATNRDGHPRGEAEVPAVDQFVDPRLMVNTVPSAHHLRGSGLYTSTPTSTGVGMWELYLHTYHPQLARKPWEIWALEVIDEPVIEIASAQDWVRFVESFEERFEGLIYPDWRKVAEEAAGVHLTVRAIAAIQGFSFETQHGITAPGFWDVEQTIWLRWAFRSPHLLRRYE